MSLPAAEPDRAAMRPHVLSILHYPHLGGPQGRNLKLARYFAATGAAEITVVLPRAPGPAAATLRDAGVCVRTVRLGRLRATRDPRVHLGTLLGWPGDVVRLVRTIRRSGAEVVLVNGLANAQGALAARLAGAGLVWQVLDTRTPPLLARGLAALARRWADAVMVTGPRVARRHFGADDDLDGRIVPFFPAVPLERFRPEPRMTRRARVALGLGSGPVVGLVANLTPQKGHPAFLRAAACLRARRPDVRFLWLGRRFAGQEAYAETLRRQAVAHGLRPGRDLLIRDPGDRVAELAAALDIGWTTSGPASEGIPTACAEVMALAIPPVAFEVGGMADLIRDGVDGRLVPSQDVAALAEVTAELLDSPSARARLGGAARARVAARCAVASCAEAHLRAFRMALAAREARRGRA